MNSRQEIIHQVLSLGGSVLLFIAAAVVISTTFDDANGMGPTGGLAMIGAIVGFVVLLAVLGLWINSNDYDED